MSEDNSALEGASPFKTFWSKSKDMVSKKNFQFKQQDPSPENNENKEASTAQTQKQHRRAQVRKAQIEHRKRKKDYTKELEQTVTRLRELISAAESETFVLREENTSIKETIAKANLPHADTSLPIDSWKMQSPHSWHQSTKVNIDFDPLVQADCLQVQTIYNPPNTHTQTATNMTLLGTDNTTTSTTTDQTYSIPGFLRVTPDQSDIAINFILALEHPCRGHFHFVPPVSTAHDPDAPATGHELMASTMLFSSAPSSTFGKTSDTSQLTTSWSAPSLELSSLYAMSLSLPKGDFEITPVQAWFLIVSEFEVAVVLERVEKLKSGLSELVKCWDFGAVLNEVLFWEVVRGVLGENQSQFGF